MLPTFEEELMELENQRMDDTDIEEMISAYQLRMMALQEQLDDED